MFTSSTHEHGRRSRYVEVRARTRRQSDGGDLSAISVFSALMICAAPMARNGSVPRRCAPRRITRAYGVGCRRGSADESVRDHCPFFFDGTQPIVYEGRGDRHPRKGNWAGMTLPKIPNGCPVVEDRLPVMWTCGVRAGKITCEINSWLTTARTPRKFSVCIRTRARCCRAPMQIS